MNIEVSFKVDYNDLKLLKELVTHAKKKNKNGISDRLQCINFVVKRNKWIAWSTDSFRLAMVEFIQNDSTHIAFSQEELDAKINHMIDVDTGDKLLYDNVYATVNAHDFKDKVSYLLKTYKNNQLDNHTRITITGVAQQLVHFEVGTTGSHLNVVVDNAEQFSLVNRVDFIDKKAHNDSMRSAIGVFDTFYGEVHGSIDPDIRRDIPITTLSPQYLLDAMKLLTINKDTHFSYMYCYDSKFYPAIFFNHTCNGEDNATNKYIWIMPKKIGEE